MKEYSFCETATAGPWGRWHIRLLDGPRKLGGGIDAPALCGVIVAWDLGVKIDRHHLNHACPECAAKLLEEAKP